MAHSQVENGFQNGITRNSFIIRYSYGNKKYYRKFFCSAVHFIPQWIPQSTNHENQQNSGCKFNNHSAIISVEVEYSVSGFSLQGNRGMFAQRKSLIKYGFLHWKFT